MTEAIAENTRQAFRVEYGSDGIAVLSFDLPGEKVNKLTTAALLELESLLEDIRGNREIDALVFISGKARSQTFVAGADIDEIVSIDYATEATVKARKAQAIIDGLRTLPQPVIAAVHGVCLGGGTELILACDFRIATIHPRTLFGFPEVKLGIIPGFGGTQRLPRLVGMRAALDMILTGKNVDARRAARLGLVDRLVAPALLREEALALAREVLNGGKRFSRRRPKRGLVDRLLDGTRPGRRLVRRLALRGLRRRVREDHYPAPYRALDAVAQGMGMRLEAGLRHEADIVGELIASRGSKNLIAVYFDSEALKRWGEPGSGADSTAVAEPSESASDEESGDVDDHPVVVFDEEIPPEAKWDRAPRRIGLLGAGVMGGAIAAVVARKGFHVRLKDIRQEALSAGFRHTRKSFDTLVRRRRLTAAGRDNLLCSISATTEARGFHHAEFIIEAVVEDMEVKKAVLGEIEPLMSQDAIFATNTSSLSIDELASSAASPERVAGMHFFNPVHRMPLVEVIHGERTSEETLRRIAGLACEIGKYPLRVANGPGFLVNRLLMPYLNEAAYLFEEGYDMVAIDQAATDFGLPMGPFALLDEVGLDVAGKVARYLHECFGDRAAPCPLLSRMVEEGKLLGKKSGAGFYLYRARGKKKANHNVLKFGGRGDRAADPEGWIRRMLYPVVNEAARCLEERIVEEAWQVDIGMIMGTGFAPFLGGPLRWADSLGLKDIVQTLERLEQEFESHGGERFRPAAQLRRLADSARGFHSGRRELSPSPRS